MNTTNSKTGAYVRSYLVRTFTKSRPAEISQLNFGAINWLKLLSRTHIHRTQKKSYLVKNHDDYQNFWKFRWREFVRTTSGVRRYGYLVHTSSTRLNLWKIRWREFVRTTSGVRRYGLFSAYK